MIVVTSGCQSASIAAALGGMLPYVDVLAAVPAPDDPVPFRDVLATTRIWITSLDLDDASAHILASGTTARVLRIPNLYFNGFHPDIVHVTAPDGTPLGSAAGEYSSAILVYGWKLGLDHEQIRAFFSADVYERLGYTSVWDRAVEYTRARFDASDVDFAGWYLPLVRRGTFMLTDNHPAVVALVQLARQLGALLGAEPELIAFPWEQVIPDGLLATSTVWPVYPELASRLGVAGGYLWRGADGALFDLDGFISRSLAGYRDTDPDAIRNRRFDSPLFADVLAREMQPAGTR